MSAAVKSTRVHALLRALLLLVGVYFAAAPGLLGCYSSAPDDDTESSEGALGTALAERFPSRPHIEQAIELYRNDAAAARARQPMSVAEFFGGERQSANVDKLRVEFLKPNPRFGDKPIAFLRAQFHGTDTYWNNRYKDVQLYRLLESTGTAHNPFPEAAHVPGEGSALVRMWTDYAPVAKGKAPSGLQGEALAQELARISVWSYVSGNVDGPAHNGNNGGFAKFRDASGREFWRGVLIDAGAAWNTPGPEHQPWNSNLLGRGSVQRANIPLDVSNGLIQIARSSAEQLAQRSKFEKVDEGALKIVREIRARAQQVLDHYGIQWRGAVVIPFRPRGRAAVVEKMAA